MIKLNREALIGTEARIFQKIDIGDVAGRGIPRIRPSIEESKEHAPTKQSVNPKRADLVNNMNA